MCNLTPYFDMILGGEYFQKYIEEHSNSLEVIIPNIENIPGRQSYLLKIKLISITLHTKYPV